MRPRTTKARKIAAIMFTDMVGYTVLWQRDERRALELLRESRRFLRCYFNMYAGVEIKTVGDGFLVEFGSALGAIECAIAIQKKLGRKESSFQIRIGIHLGEVFASDGDVLGTGVNMAARLEPLAEPGGICFSQQMYDQVHQQVREKITRLDKVKIKNVAHRVDLYRINFGNPGASHVPAQPMEKQSVAVLPFVNITPDQENDYLSDGITEDLITGLSQVKGLRVPASTSMFSFKGKKRDVRQIGRELGVSNVLEGSVRRSGNRLRVTANLVNAADGCSLWSEKYDREVADVFAIQEEISRAIVSALKLHLGEKEQWGWLIKAPTGSAEAYQLYLKGRHFWMERGEGLRKGMHYFELALLEDKDYALAYAGLADSYLLLGYYGYLPPKEAFPKARTAAEQALQIQGNLAEAHCSLGYVNFLYDWDPVEAEKRFQKAIELSPKYITAYYWYSSCLLGMGRKQEALAGDYRALETDPLSVLTNAHYAWTLVGLRQYEAAIAQCRKTIGMAPQFAVAYRLLGQAYIFLGRHPEAIEAFKNAVDYSGHNPSMKAWLAYGLAVAGRKSEGEGMRAELEELSKRAHVRALLLALASAGFGRKEETMAALHRAYEEHDFWMQWLAIDAAFDFLHEESDFQELLRKVGSSRKKNVKEAAPSEHGALLHQAQRGRLRQATAADSH